MPILDVVVPLDDSSSTSIVWRTGSGTGKGTKSRFYSEFRSVPRELSQLFLHQSVSRVGASALLRYSLPLPVCLSIRNCYRGGEVFKLNLLHPKDYSIEINDSIDGSRFLSHHPLFIHLHCLFCPLLILPL